MSHPFGGDRPRRADEPQAPETPMPGRRLIEGRWESYEEKARWMLAGRERAETGSEDSEPEGSEYSDSVSEYRSDIAVRLEPWKVGEKTKAWYVGQDGDEQYFDSGRRPETRSILDAAVPGYDQYIVVDHVEAHVSARMRSRNEEVGSLYINKVPCPGPFGCDELLAEMLPPDARLTVYGPDGYHKVYEGGDQ